MVRTDARGSASDIAYVAVKYSFLSQTLSILIQQLPNL